MGTDFPDREFDGSTYHGKRFLKVIRLPQFLPVVRLRYARLAVTIIGSACR